MSLVQNYIGLDARIYAIVQSLLNGETIDLSNYYTKDEVDALIASGGGSLTIDYNSLTNRPIIDGLLQSNLDLNNNLLLYNGKPLYLPEFNEADSTIVFDNNCVIPNIYTKEEVDQKIAEAGGGGGGTTDYNQLTNKPIDNYVLQKSLDCGAHTLTNIAGIESKIVLIPNVAKLYDYRFMCDLDTLQLIANRTLLATFNNSGITYFAESGKLFSITRDGVADKITSANTALEVRCNNIVLAGSDTDGRVVLSAKDIVFNGNLNNVYTKEECDQKFGGAIDYNQLTNKPINNYVLQNELDCGGHALFNVSVIAGNMLQIYNAAKLYEYRLICEENTLQLIANNSTLLATLNTSGINYFADSDKIFSVSRNDTVDKITSANTALEIKCNNIVLAGNDIDGDVVLSAKNIVFNGTLNNVYTKEEVNALIAGGGGGTSNYHGPVTNGIVESSGYGRAWILNYTQSAPIDKYGLLLTTNEDNDNATGIIYDYTRKTIGFGNLSNLANTPGLTYKTDTDLLSVGKLSVLGNIDAESIVASVELSAPNIYTKTEVDEKIASGTGLLIKGADTDATVESINAEINNTPDGFAKMFKSNYNGTYQMQTIFAVKLDVSRQFAFMFPKASNIFRFQTEPNGNWYTVNASGNVTVNGGAISESQITSSVSASPNNSINIYNTNAGTLSRSDSTVIGIKGASGRSLILSVKNGSDTLQFWNNSKWYSVQGIASLSQTITHEAPFTGDILEYTVGDPVFASGRVCKYDTDNDMWSYNTSATDCICEVKDTGTVDEYVGICVGFKEDTHSLIFATHGDYYFNVADSSIYKTGDIVLLDGTILKDDTPITGKIMKMIVGKVTGKVSKNIIAVLKD